MKSYSPAVIAALQSPNGHTFAHCFTLKLAAGNLLLTDSDFDIVHNGVTFSETALIEELDETRQETDLVVQEYQLTFTNADQTLLALFQNKEQRGRVVVIERVIMQDNSNVTLGTLLSNRFIISSYASNGVSMVVTLKSAIANLMQPRGIATTMESFRRYYPETTSCINASNVTERFKWGFE